MSFRDAIPLYPRLVVEKLPRSTEHSGLYISDLETNKPIHEARVLRVWRTRRQHKIQLSDEQLKAITDLASTDDGCGPDNPCTVCTAIAASKVMLEGVEMNIACDIKEGDIILFHHSHGFATDPGDPEVCIVDERHVMGVITQ